MTSRPVSRALGLLATAATLGLGVADARADVLRTTLGQPVREVSHAVDITVAEGIATYRVRRVFVNPGEVADEAGLEIDLPFGAAATGLRIRARHRWYDAELMERAKAAALYEELTRKGAFAPKDQALLQWLWPDKLYLQVFPVLPGQTSTVEYTLTVPTRYQGGKVFLSYPRLAAVDPGAEPDAPAAEVTRPLVLPVLTVTPRWGDATTRVVVDGLRTTPGSPIVLGAAVTPPWFERVGGSLEASYIASSLTVPATAAAKKRFTKVKVTLAIGHTYRSDLRVDLLTPGGGRLVVHDGSGGGDNDLKGAFTLDLPAGTTGTGRWELIVSDHAARDVGTLDRWSIELGTGAGAVKAAATDLPIFIADAPESASDAGVATLELAPPAIDVLAARLGKVVASSKHAFSRLELDLAPELRPLPKQARVVFVVDASHSMGPKGIDMQLAMVKAYLAHVPDAAAEIVLYRRTAVRLFGGFVAAQDVAARIAAARTSGALAPGNGSALEEGARLATAALVGQKGPLRVVITTDELLRTTFTPTLAIGALARLPAAAIVHVAVPSSHGDHDPTLARDDQTALASLARAHHGILARLNGLAAASDKALTAQILGLVRPIQIDRVKVAGFALEGPDGVLEGDEADVLREGAGLQQMKALASAPDTVTISGLVWSDPFRRVVRVDPTFARATAGWVFSEDMHDELSVAEQLEVAFFGRAVSPVTSYLAVEPGVRPSTAGIDPQMSYGSGLARGSGSGSGGHVTRPRVKPDLMALVAAAARQCVATHEPAAGWSVSVDVETTLDEVVDVALASAGRPPLAGCLVEAVWAVRLGRDFDLARERFTLTFR